jgi:putative transposase
MSRGSAQLRAIDVSTWPTVAYTQFDDTTRHTFEKRVRAVMAYLQGESVKQIERSTGIDRRQLYRWLERAGAIHPDGRPFGFRALVRYARSADYVRLRAVPDNIEPGGAAGALSQLLERYPTLSDWLHQQIRQRKVWLEEVNSDGALRTRLRGLQALHENFLRQCRAVGLSGTDYPFNTCEHGIRSLSRHVKDELLRSFGCAARSAGASHLKGLPRRDGEARSLAATRPYQAVEFDGHRLDIRLKMVVHDPLGFVHEFEMERIWLLVIIDVCTRAVLGYHLVLAREYSRYDVIKTIENALEPHRARTFSVPGLAYGPQDGFPSQRFPELAYATWEWIRLDNAKANLANETLTALCEFVGCLADAGPKYSPDERPYIERFFGTIASRLSARLPGYTGSNPWDLRRALANARGNLRLYVSIDELDDLIEYAIANYNGTPHSGLNNVTPLEAMEYFVRGKQTLVTWLAHYHRRSLCLMQSARRCRVCAYLDQGVRPHINLYTARYTNSVLARSTHLIGQEVLVYLNASDLRSVRAFLPDGTELGELDVQGLWRMIPHNLKLRQEICKQMRVRRRRGVVDTNPIETYVKEKFEQAKKNRKAATELANTMRLITSAQRGDLPVSPAVPHPEPNTVESLGPVPDPGPMETPDDRPPGTHARPRRLSIGTGQVF